MANSNTQIAPTPRADRSRPSQRSNHESRHNPPRANAKYSSMRFPTDAATENSFARPPSPTVRYAQSVTTTRPFQRKGSSASVRSARPPTPVSKGSMDGSHSSAQHGPQSTLLQEKLQQERRSEIQRSLTRLADEMGTDNDSKPTTATPTRSATSDPKQQDPGSETTDSKAKGLALKETEQVSPEYFKTNPSVAISSCADRGLHRQCQLCINRISTSSWNFFTAESVSPC